ERAPMSARPRPKRVWVATSDAWRGPTGQLRLFGAPPPLIFLEAKAWWLLSASLGRGCVARTRALAPSAPAIAGEGDHWSSRSERTVVEGGGRPRGARGGGRWGGGARRTRSFVFVAEISIRKKKRASERKCLGTTK